MTAPAPTPDKGNNRLFAWCQGKTGFFLIFWAVNAVIFHWFHRLDGSFTSFFTIFMAATVAHSYKDDKHQQAMAAIDTQGKAGQ
jgi:hypothetical protein